MKILTRRLTVLAACLAALVAVAGGAVAQSPPAEELMASANERYSRGEYVEAAQQYESLLAGGFRDAALYYNLGNAYFQQSDLGRATLNYLRAERLSPRDPDIRSNLALARSNTVDNLQVVGRFTCREFGATRTSLGDARRNGGCCSHTVDCGQHIFSRSLRYHPVAHTSRPAARRSSLRSVIGAGCASNMAECVTCRPLQQYRGSNRGDGRGRERTRLAVRNSIHPSQRRSGAAG